MRDGMVLVVVGCAVAGLAAGSLLTKVVPRVPQQRPLRLGSRCDRCGHQLGGREVVPVVSWLAQGNRCRWCRHSIGASPLAIEIVTPLLFVVIGVRLGANPVVPAYCVLAAGLVALSAIDVELHRLPREITYTTIAVGGPLLAAAAIIDDRPGRLIGAVAGAVIALAVMWVAHRVTGGDLGDGDVRLAPLLGLFLGYSGVVTVGVGLLAGFALAAVAGVGLVAVRRRNQPYPFGPFLAAGTFATLLVAGSG